jgi:hypothetical protein
VDNPSASHVGGLVHLHVLSAPIFSHEPEDSGGPPSASGRYMASSLPLLLPQKALPQLPNAPHLEWKPQRHLSEPQPPPQDESKIQEETLANARLMIDGKLIKKTRPRRTVDYNGGMGRWAFVGRLDAVV